MYSDILHRSYGPFPNYDIITELCLLANKEKYP